MESTWNSVYQPARTIFLSFVTVVVVIYLGLFSELYMGMGWSVLCFILFASQA